MRKIQQKPEPFLYEHQKQAIDRMFDGCILNGGTGSGKSRTGIYYFFHKNGGSIDPYYEPMRSNPPDLYIITTAKKRNDHEWEGELTPFRLSPDPELNTYYNNKVVIDSWQNIKKYENVKGAQFIFDESKITTGGVWSKSFLKIAKANSWILLSASPADSWEQYETIFVANGFFKNRTEFRQEHLEYDRYAQYPRIVGYKNEGRLIRLRNKLLIDMDFKRTATQNHFDVYCDYDIQKYRQATRTRTNPFKQFYIPCRENDPDALLVGFDIDRSEVEPVDPGFDYTPINGDYVRLINEPIQLASSMCYVWRKIVNLDQSRQVKLLEILEDHPKVILFYNFDDELDVLLNLSYIKGTVVRQYNGHKHEPIPLKNERWVYLCQFNSCEGWNCIATDCIIFYSQNYSYKNLLQACGRIDRLTTPYSQLWYFHLKSRAPIDIAISQALKKKKKFNERKFIGNNW